MKKDTIKGIVKNVTRTEENNLLFFTLSPIRNEIWEEARIPVYVKIIGNYIGRPVNITTEEFGFIKKRYRQTIDSPDFSETNTLDMKTKRQMDKKYNRN